MKTWIADFLTDLIAIRRAWRGLRRAPIGTTTIKIFVERWK